MFTIILVFSFISIKHKSTQLTDNAMLQILAFNVVLAAVSELSVKYGSCGFNPALATGYISFAVSQYAYPNIISDVSWLDIYGFESSAVQVNHYLWAYMLAPIVGGAVAGVLHLVHAKVSSVKGKDNNVSSDNLIE